SQISHDPEGGCITPGPPFRNPLPIKASSRRWMISAFEKPQRGFHISARGCDGFYSRVATPGKPRPIFKTTLKAVVSLRVRHSAFRNSLPTKALSRQIRSDGGGRPHTCPHNRHDAGQNETSLAEFEERIQLRSPELSGRAKIQEAAGHFQSHQEEH